MTITKPVDLSQLDQEAKALTGVHQGPGLGSIDKEIFCYWTTDGQLCVPGATHTHPPAGGPPRLCSTATKAYATHVAVNPTLLPI